MAEQANGAPEEECFLFEDRVHTNAAVDSRIDEVVRGLIAVGIRQGAHIGVLMDTSPSAVVAIAAGLAVAGCGGSSSSGAAAGGNAASKSPAASHSTGSSGSTSVATATVPFPFGVGDTWRYRTTDGRTVNRIIAVTPAYATIGILAPIVVVVGRLLQGFSAGGELGGVSVYLSEIATPGHRGFYTSFQSASQQVTMRSAITSLGSTSHDTAYYVVHSDGSISLPFSQFDTSSSGASVKLISGSIFWPPADQLSSGKAYHDALKIEFSTNGTTQNVTAHVTVRGAGTQSVTVPAGTYNADVVNMTMAETIEGISVSKPALEDVFIRRTGHKFWSETAEATSGSKNQSGKNQSTNNRR